LNMTRRCDLLLYLVLQLNMTWGWIFSQLPTSVQTHNFLTPDWEGAFFKEFLVI
jgi:hypothetical protein